MGRGADGKRMWVLEIKPLTSQSCDFTYVLRCQAHRSWVLCKKKEGAVMAEVLQLSREGLVVTLAPAAGRHCRGVLRWEAQTVLDTIPLGMVVGFGCAIAFLLLCHRSKAFAASRSPNEGLCGDYSPLGSCPLPSLVNLPRWIAAMVWWFGLFVSYKVQSHRM